MATADGTVTVGDVTVVTVGPVDGRVVDVVTRSKDPILSTVVGKTVVPPPTESVGFCITVVTTGTSVLRAVDSATTTELVL